jgi:hypothetical protein
VGAIDPKVAEDENEVPSPQLANAFHFESDGRLMVCDLARLLALDQAIGNYSTNEKIAFLRPDAHHRLGASALSSGRAVRSSVVDADAKA